MLNLNTIICKELDINIEEFEASLGRGMKPVKAAIKCGADHRKAQLVAGLKLATTATEIDEVYANVNVKSCMTGKYVGQFYKIHGVGVIYSDMFRTLINLKTFTISRESYGFHCSKVGEILRKYFLVGPVVEANSFYTATYKSKRFESFITYAHIESMKILSLTNLNYGEVSNNDRTLLHYYVLENFKEIQQGVNLVTLRNGSLLSFRAQLSSYVEDIENDSEITLGEAFRSYGRELNFQMFTSLETIKQEVKGSFDITVETSEYFDEDKFEEEYPGVYVPFLDDEYPSVEVLI